MPRVGVVGLPDGWSSQQLVEALRPKVAWVGLIDMGDVVFDLEAGAVWQGDLDLCTLDAIVVKKVGSPYSPDLLDRLAILRFIEGRGVRVFSKPAVMKRLVDRLSCTVSLRLGEIPMPPTVITESIDRALGAVEAFGRAVLKPLYTSKARGMTIVEANADARQQLEEFQKAGNAVLYVQELLHLSGRDLGIAFLGGELLGAYARVSQGDSWNTTTHSGGKYEACSPEPAILELAQRAQDLFDLDFTSVDVAITDQGPVVFEVSAFGGFRGLLEACGINAAERYADYVVHELSHAV
jgi:tetrahydromethanopterin:alpha-L-glutamate ligase